MYVFHVEFVWARRILEIVSLQTSFSCKILIIKLYAIASWRKVEATLKYAIWTEMLLINSIITETSYGYHCGTSSASIVNLTHSRSIKLDG